jgi:pilus assembly protein CpaF
MLQAMNTGHDGSMSTIHANSARDAIARMEDMMLMANANLPIHAVRSQIASAVDLIVQTARMRDGVRRVTEMVEIVGVEGEVVSLSTLFSYQYQGENVDGTLRGTFVSSNMRPRFLPRMEYFGLGEAFMAAMATKHEPPPS